MEYIRHLYMIVHPAPALIASHYAPEEFASHYISGSTRFYDGKVLFAEVDINYRNEWFDIDEALKLLVPHHDGQPKATKFVKCYRIIEHVDFNSILAFYITNPDGSSLRLDRYEEAPEVRGSGVLRVYAEINPLSMLVLSRSNYREFGEYITQGDHFKSVPRLCYTQLEFDAQEFLKEFDRNSFMQPPIPGVHPSKLRDAVEELLLKPEKQTKGISLDSQFNKIPYKMVRHGFMFSGMGQYVCFRMPSALEIEEKHVRFWRGMY